MHLNTISLIQNRDKTAWELFLLKSWECFSCFDCFLLVFICVIEYRITELMGILGEIYQNLDYWRHFPKLNSTESKW